jgi:hypothetical protein
MKSERSAKPTRSAKTKSKKPALKKKTGKV